VNINQAKALAGLPSIARVTGRDGAERALKALKPLIVQARRLGDDSRAAKLSEAKEIFRKRLVGSNRCEVCGNPISASATRCRLCLRPKALPLTAAYRAIAPDNTNQDWPTANPNARLSVATNPLALSGYYTPPVQKVVSKWRGTIPEETLKGYFVAVWPVARHKGTFLNIKGVEPKDWPAVFELGLAVCAVYGNKTKLPFWLLTLPIHTGPNYRFPDYADISVMIRKRGGKDFTPGAIQKSLKSMKLVTGREEATQVRRDFAIIRGLWLKRQKVETVPVETETA
jgi:hypothetical protein